MDRLGADFFRVVKMIEERLGAGYLERNRPDLAIEHYELALQLNPNYPNAQHALGVVLLRYLIHKMSTCRLGY